MPPIFERLTDNIEGNALVCSQYQAHSLNGLGTVLLGHDFNFHIEAGKISGIVKHFDNFFLQPLGTGKLALVQLFLRYFNLNSHPQIPSRDKTCCTPHRLFKP